MILIDIINLVKVYTFCKFALNLKILSDKIMRLNLLNALELRSKWWNIWTLMVKVVITPIKTYV